MSIFQNDKENHLKKAVIIITWAYFHWMGTWQQPVFRCIVYFNLVKTEITRMNK